MPDRARGAIDMAKKASAAKAVEQTAVKAETADRKIARRHVGHENHLCELVAKRRMAEVAKVARDARYMCHICGRASSKPESVCEPVEI